MTEDTTSVSLSEAAEELIKAATLVVKTSSQRKDLSSIKESLDAKINTVNQNICQLKDQLTNVNASIEHQAKIQSSVNQNICELKDQVAKVTASIERQTKMQSLEWAIQNLALFEGHSFEYYIYVKNYGIERKSSKNHAKDILLSFRQGRGHCINDGSLSQYGESSEKTKSEFRDKLVEYIYTLTGIMPRLKVMDNGNYAIYYS